MSDFNNLSELRHFAAFYGIKVNTNAPGDGVRRYEFAHATHGILGRELGIRAAASWLSGYSKAADLFGGREQYGKNPVHADNPPPELVFSDEDFGVFLWREDGKYDIADSVGNYKRQSAAETFAEKLNAKHHGDGGYVVRTLKYCRRHP